MHRKEPFIFFATFLLSAGLTAITAFLPMYASVPKLIYANIVPTVLMCANCSAAGILYAVLGNVLLNSIGMGSGVMPNTLIYLALEAFLLTFFFYRKDGWKGKAQKLLFRVLLFLPIAVFGLKFVSYLLYPVFHTESLGDRRILEYAASNYSQYLKNGLTGNFLIYLTSVPAGLFLAEIIKKTGRLIDSGNGSTS